MQIGLLFFHLHARLHTIGAWNLLQLQPKIHYSPWWCQCAWPSSESSGTDGPLGKMAEFTSTFSSTGGTCTGARPPDSAALSHADSDPAFRRTKGPSHSERRIFMAATPEKPRCRKSTFLRQQASRTSSHALVTMAAQSSIRAPLHCTGAV